MRVRLQLIVAAVLVPLIGAMPRSVMAGEFFAVAAGSDHALVIHSDGTIWSWGNNQYGQLGDGTLNPVPPYGVHLPVRPSRFVAFSFCSC